MTEDDIVRKELTPFDALSGQTTEKPDETDLIESEEPVVKDVDEGEGEPPQPEPKPEDTVKGEETDEGGKPNQDEGPVNQAKVLAEHWKQSGMLPADYEISEDISLQKLESDYRGFIEQEALNEVELKVKNQYGQDVFDIAQKIKRGYDQPTLTEIEYWKTVSQIEVEGDSEKHEQIRREVILRDLVNIKGIEQEEAVDIVDTYFEKGKDVEKAKAAVKSFSSYAEQLEKKEEQRVAALEQQRQEEANKRRKRIESLLKKRKFAGKEYTEEQIKQFKKATEEKTEVWTDPETNKRYRVTPFKKKQLELQNNEEAQLANMIDFVLNISSQEEVSKVKRQGGNEILEKLISGSQTPPTIKKENTTEVRDDGIKRKAII